MIKVELPDGRTLDIDTDDPKAAASAAQKFMGGGPKAEAAPTDDIYTSTAKKELAEREAKGVPTGGNYSRLAAQGMTFNAADEILAGMTTPFEMIKRGTWNPVEGYKYAKAIEDVGLEDARKKTGTLGNVAEIGGGVGSGLGLVRGGITAARGLAQGAGLLPRAAASAADGAGMGLVSGAMDGNSLSERGSNALQGGLLGGFVGGAAPIAGAAIKTAAAPVISNIRARVNPEGFAQSQVARAVMESGQTPGQLTGAVAQAGREGQGMFTLADAMGNPGQRMLSTVTRSPGQGRTEAVEFLEQRQAGQGRRIANSLVEGFDAPQTPAQLREGMTAARNSAADTAYDAARNNAGPVDVSNVIATIDRTLRPGVNQIARPQSGIANDSIESALEGFRSKLTDGRSVQTDFTSIQRLRGDISDAAQAAQQSGYGNKARMLGQVLRELDASMERASQGYRAANQNFAQASRNIEAIDDGVNASMRGRTEDIIPAFRAQTPQGQQAYRTGYADPLIREAQGAAFGVNKARPLTNDAFRDEAAVMAPGNNLMQNRIGRENTMFETRRQAVGGSQTADNLADGSAMGIDPGIVGQVLSGNMGGALRSMMSAGSNVLSGNTAEVRQAVGNLLLQRGQNINSAHVQRLLDSVTQRIQALQLIAQQSGRGALGGVAMAPSAVSDK